MKLLAVLGLVLSLSVSAQPAMVQVDEFELEYEIAGQGEPIVLLEAGGSAGMSDWDPVFESIAEFTTVIRYSRVGNGGSTAIRRHFTSRDYADNASELLTQLDINQPVVLVAHSYGGSVARDFAAAYPQKLQALLMLDPSSEHDVDILRAIDLDLGNQQIAEIKLSDMENGMSNQYLDFWSKRPLPNYPQIHDMPVTVIASVRKIEQPDNLFFSDEGRVMWGELWQNWAHAFPQGKSILTEQSGHFIQNDEPDLVIAELQALIAQLDGAEYCDFRLYAPGLDANGQRTLVLQRADLTSMRWGTENNIVYWYIDVADHAMDKWQESVNDSVGLSMPIYCGDVLVAEPTIRAPLGAEFKVAGLEDEARRWK